MHPCRRDGSVVKIKEIRAHFMDFETDIYQANLYRRIKTISADLIERHVHLYTCIVSVTCQSLEMCLKYRI